MLPNRKKKFAIIVAIIIGIVLLVVAIASISGFINNRNNKEKGNDNYANLYEYFGITKDEDGIYKLVGINETEEKYLDLKTFYEVLDVKIINNRIVLYSDATNEVRYDTKSKEFYFYELDSNYENNYNYKLTDTHLIKYNDNILSIREYGKDEQIITDSLSKKQVITYLDQIYYLSNNTIFKYDLTNNYNSTVTTLTNSDISFVGANDYQVYYIYDNELYLLNINNKISINISEYINTDFEVYSIEEDGIIYLDKSNKVLKRYTIGNGNIKEYSSFNNINEVKKVNGEIYYLKQNGKNILVNLKDEEVIKELSNNYLYIVKVGENAN